MPDYTEFGRRLAAWRLAAGFGQQADLATRVGATQQSISRWERGESRPRANQIPAIAEALRVTAADVLAAAGYAPVETTAAFDQPFPVEALNEDSFERFCSYALELIYPEADVHRVGGKGHTQDGTDVDVTHRNGKIFSFQCKREKEFGPQKVHAAVAKFTRKAERKFILLARVASPQARQAIAQHKGWDIWDKEDITREVRKLPKEEQRRLVDIFFPGKRFALLGESSPGPWQTSDEYFRPYLAENGAFSHKWHLVGRGEELSKLDKALNDKTVHIIRVIGAGGLGKTRLLREAISNYQKANAEITVRFLSATEDATRKSLEDLGARPKLLVVDDCHDRNDLGVLFEFAACGGARLVLGFRPYGADLLRHEASRFGLVDDRVSDVSLAPLKLAESVTLASQILKDEGASTDAAAHIAELTRDCPLSTVMAAHVVAKDGRHAELAKNAEEFRTTLMGRFIDYTTGSIGSKGEELSIKKVLRVLALTQPFNTDDTRISDAIHIVEGLEHHETARLIRVINDGGIIFKRGGRYRLSPDLLADAIIEDACITADGKSTGYAERVFDAVRGQPLENLITNLGRLDWRRSNGDPSKSKLLDGIWSKLNPQEEFGDPYLKAVRSVAYYQPGRAIDICERLMREGRCLRDLPEILKFAGYNLDHLTAACECLWQLGAKDNRDTNPYPEHAIRILKELCEIKPNKPQPFIKLVVDFGLSLLDLPDSWSARHTPYDFLQSVLEADGHTTSWGGRLMTIERFNINYAYVQSFREKFIGKIIASLEAPVLPKRALRSARLIHQALRSPDTNREAWDLEFCNTMSKIAQLVTTRAVAPVVLVAIAESVSWHAHYGSGDPQTQARKVVEALPNSLEFRATLALVDGYGQLTRKLVDDAQKDREEFEQQQIELADELIKSFVPFNKLKEFLERLLADIALHGGDVNNAPRPFLNVLANRSDKLAAAIIESVIKRELSIWGMHADIALAALLRSNSEAGFEAAERFVNSGDATTRSAVGYAYALSAPPQLMNATAKRHVKKLLQMDDPLEVASGVAALRSMLEEPRSALDLLAGSNFASSARLADSAMMLFALNNRVLFSQMTDDDVHSILNKLRSLNELEGHWIEEFLAQLSSSHGEVVAKFFMDRVDEAERLEDWKLRPCNHGPYGHVPLKFRSSPDFARILQAVVGWLYAGANKGLVFRTRSSELFSTMFSPFDETILSVLKDLSVTADETELRAISRILREAPSTVIIEERLFVSQFLSRCQQYGEDCYRYAGSHLFGAAVSGERSGVPGQPFKRDLETRDRAKQGLLEFPRFSPAYEFYSDLLQYAETEIKRADAEREMFDEE